MKKNKNQIIREILPFNINVRYNYLEVDNKCMSTITVIKYDKIVFLEVINALLADFEVQISFHIKRQNSPEFLKKLTSVISISGSEINSINKNQIDSEVVMNNKKEAEDIKKKIQVDNEQIYLVETYIKVSGYNEHEVISKVKEIINRLYVLNIIAKPCNFRQKEAFLSVVPIMLNSAMLSKYTENIFTNESLAMLFPFFTYDIYNFDGVIMGRANNNICKINLLSDVNINYNMCVFGSSGAGKSYYIKLHILRNLYKGINQIVIDPEGEYMDLVKKVGGVVYTIDNYNPLYIEETYAKSNSDFFRNKIETIRKYIEARFDFNESDRECSVITKLYNHYGINQDIDSLYLNGDDDNIYIKKKYKEVFPKLTELLQELNIKFEDTSVEESKINNSSKLHCFHIKSKSIDSIKKEMTLFIPKIYELIESDTLVYFDEIWKCISMGQDKTMLEEIYNMFKTLRKKKTGIIAISQDIGDLFSIDAGNFGKSILNNSHTKVFFKLEYSDVEKLRNISLADELIEKKIFNLDRGQAYIKQGNSCYKLEIIANEYENKLIEGEMNSEEYFNCNK